MNLYVWETGGVRSYHNGMIIALANTETEAKLLIDAYDRKNVKPTDVILLQKMGLT